MENKNYKKAKWVIFRCLLLVGIACFAYLHPGARQWMYQRVCYCRDYFTNPIPKDTLPPSNISSKTKISLEVDTLIKEDLEGFDWPQFRGANRDDICRETGLLQKWPKNGPKKILSIKGIGRGYSSPVIYGKRLVITGTNDNRSFVYCFDIHGKLIWQRDHGPEFPCNSYPGTRNTATIENNRIYLLSTIGRLTAFDLKTGKEFWRRNILRDFKGPFIDYGLAESVLIYGNKLICTPGGLGSEIVALDKRTGKTIWTSSGSNDIAGYGSAIIMKFGAKDILLATLHHALVGLDPQTGEQFWRYSKPFSRGRICMTPVVHQDMVFIMGGERCGGGAIQLQQNHNKIGFREMWDLEINMTHFGGYVCLDGKIYGANGIGWVCLDLKTKKQHYRLLKPRKCSTVFADKRFICLEKNGAVYLLEANSVKARVVSKFKLPNAGRQTWARPAISRGRLYIRRKNQLHIYDIRKKTN